MYDNTLYGAINFLNFTFLVIDMFYRVVYIQCLSGGGWIPFD